MRSTRALAKTCCIRIATASALGTLAMFGGSASFALTPAVCGPYADKAVEQSIEYFTLRCKNGNSQWWSKDRQYHYGWCMLEPANSDAAAKGEEDREKALAECATQIAADEEEEKKDPNANGPRKKVAEGLACRMRIGDVEFRDDQVEGGIAPYGGGGDGMSAVCNYHHPEGTMSIGSKWAVWLPANVPGPRLVIGCAKNKPKEQQEGETSRGYFVISLDKFAEANAFADTNFMIKLARGDGRNAAGEMLKFAHTQGAKACW
jgi:hypothetical protein